MNAAFGRLAHISLVALFASMVGAACSSQAVADGGTDVATSDAANDIAQDVAMDAPATDVPADVGNDTSLADTATDAPSACGTSTDCHPFFCGCGSCNPADIVCVSDPRTCPLGCPSSCPETATTVCDCVGGACEVVHSDGGASDGGPRPDAAVGTACTSDSECGSGLLCCYPCGIPGCTNACSVPMDGQCPALP